jgi:hypothetical protein
MRGYEYLQFIGHKAFFADVELRYPLIECRTDAAWRLGGLRGVLFFNIGGSVFNNQDFRRSLANGSRAVVARLRQHPIFGIPIPSTVRTRSGQRLPLVDSQARTASACQTSLLGFPMHFDWAGRRSSTGTYEDVAVLRRATARSHRAAAHLYRR